MLDKYTRTARVYPAILSSIPIFILDYYLLQQYTAGFFASIEAIKLVGGVTLSVALTYLLAQAGRFIGKELFEGIYFKDELHMPTTELLLHSNPTYSNGHKDKIRTKILSDFGIQLPSTQQEDLDDTATRRSIVEAVGLIRGKVKRGQLLLQHNIEYGFIRNLAGGSLLALYISILNLCIFGYLLTSPVGFRLSLFIAITYLIVVVISKYMIGRYGMRYAKVLFQEYLLT